MLFRGHITCRNYSYLLFSDNERNEQMPPLPSFTQTNKTLFIFGVSSVIEYKFRLVEKNKLCFILRNMVTNPVFIGITFVPIKFYWFGEKSFFAMPSHMSIILLTYTIVKLVFYFYRRTPVVTGNGQTARDLLRKARDGGHFPRLRIRYTDFIFVDSIKRVSGQKSCS